MCTVTRSMLHLNVFEVRYIIYLLIIIPEDANIAKRWVLKNIEEKTFVSNNL